MKFLLSVLLSALFTVSCFSADSLIAVEPPAIRSHPYIQLQIKLKDLNYLNQSRLIAVKDFLLSKLNLRDKLNGL